VEEAVHPLLTSGAHRFPDVSGRWNRSHASLVQPVSVEERHWRRQDSDGERFGVAIAIGGQIVVANRRHQRPGLLRIAVRTGALKLSHVLTDQSLLDVGIDIRFQCRKDRTAQRAARNFAGKIRPVGRVEAYGPRRHEGDDGTRLTKQQIVTALKSLDTGETSEHAA
jgi:hypothetical protein